MSHFLGLDIGSTTTKAVLLGGDGRIAITRVIPTGPNVKRTIEAVMAGLPGADILRTVATGYGRKRVEFKTRETTEITCHARGVAYRLPATRTVIDVGGQDSKVIRLGPNGKVLDFVMNDRCAAGTGAFLETMARALQMDLDDLSHQATLARDHAPISSVCTVFAQTEVVHLVSEDVAQERICRGVFVSVVERILPLVRRLQAEPPFALSGGVALLPAFAPLLSAALGHPVAVPEQPQLAGALGAALLAREG
jgi:predicted CoA-substrate-specific enzyme activase